MKQRTQDIINIARAYLGVPVFLYILYNDFRGNHIPGNLFVAGGCLLFAGIIIYTEWNTTCC